MALTPTQLLWRLPRWAVLSLTFLVTAEVFVRVDQGLTYGAPFSGPWSNEYLTVRDSLGLHGRPGYRFEKWKMNNQGFRGPEIGMAVPPGRIRVATLGASETFGLYETEGMEYPAQLRTALDTLAPGRYELVNVALAGMSLSAMVPYYREYVARFRPRYVLLYPSPSFYLEINPLPPAPPPPEHAAPADHLDRGPWFQSRLLAKSRDILKETIPVWVVTTYREWSLRRSAARAPAGWVWASVPADRMELLRAHLDTLVETIAASGAVPVLITHTNRYLGLTPEAVARDRRHLVNLRAVYYPRASDEVMVKVDSAANSVIRQTAARHGIPLIEAEGRFPPGAQSFADYAHFTNSGARRMADLLAHGFLAIDADSAQRSPGGP